MSFLKCSQTGNCNYTYGLRKEQMTKIAAEEEAIICPKCGQKIMGSLFKHSCPVCEGKNENNNDS